MANRRDFLRLGAGTGAAALLAAAPITAFASGAVPSGRRGAVDWATLRRHLTGDVVLPDDAAYEQAHQVMSAQFDAIRPQAVAFCESAADVATAVRFAGDNALHAVPRSGGHSFGGYSTTDGMILDVSRMNKIQVNGATVTVGSGTQQIDALTALSPHGLLLAGGQCATVGVGGFLQGGGIGMLARKAGLGADRMLSAEVVLADGRVVRASGQENADLFWALRGNGGGNYGVVTSYELEPVRVPSMVNYSLAWPIDAAKQVVESWQPWAIGAPWELGASLAVYTPDAATVPPQVVAYGAWFGSPAALDRLLDTLVAQAGVAPATREAAEKTPYDAMMEWYGCTQLTSEQCHRVGYSPGARLPRENFYQTRNRMFSGPAPAVDDLLGAYEAGPRAGQLRMLYFETLGGQAGVPDRRSTAYVHRNARMLCGYSISLTNPDYTAEDTAACEQWLAGGFAALDPHSLGESYQNFIDPALPDWQNAYYAENYPALVAVRQRYDPHRFFHFDRAIS
ncbi:FAD-dependent oxidoreductase [Amycolatopsis saalfeldensis]|uniref:FAD/FMN-containing dehydrogenase n=1 Tax=Amycolatopsis saalfeldensis TaxID=394193 RepID=A0A1H8YJM5_9PSEU|nr:FAD-binding oxidoreductase [Amycolatopsis saalfeldensis]SEP52370.1 FAD/FMN-containing dehydrogenase [Amycolatopsis saalfeldensis]